MRKFEITRAEGGSAFPVWVVPNARRNEVVGVHGGAIKIRITASPVEGAANEALLRFLAQRLGVRENQLEIVAGATSRRKMVSVVGLSPHEVESRLLGG